MTVLLWLVRRYQPALLESRDAALENGTWAERGLVETAT